MCETVHQSPPYGVHTAVAWEMQVSTFSLATHFGHYHTTFRMSFESELFCQGLNYDAIRVWHQDLLLIVHSRAEVSVCHHLAVCVKNYPAYVGT